MIILRNMCDVFNIVIKYRNIIMNNEKPCQNNCEVNELILQGPQPLWPS